MKPFKKFGAMLVAAAMCVATMGGAAAFAANYTPQVGTSMTFNKYLVMDKQANVPNVTFNYTIAEGAAADITVSDGTTTSTNKAVAGKVVKDATGKVTAPTVGSAAFQTSDAAYEQVQTDDAVTLGTDQKYAKKTVTVDFSGVSFTEPGIYRYVITEVTTPAAQAIGYDTKTTRILDVYVVDDTVAATSTTAEQKKLKIDSYILHENTTDAINSSSTPAAQANKSTGFTNTYDTSDLTISKMVTGNQGSRDKYFAFTVSITGAVKDTVYDVDLANATQQFTGKPNEATTVIPDSATQTSPLYQPTKLTADGGTVTATYYLQHGQSVKVQGIASATKVKVVEEADADYTTTRVIKDSDNAAMAPDADDFVTVASKDFTAAFTNDRGGIIPTGLMIAVAPGLALVVLAAAGLFFLLRKKREEA